MNDEIKKLKAAAEKVAQIRADIKAFDGDKRGMLSALEDATDEYHELVCRFPVLALIERTEAAEKAAWCAGVNEDGAKEHLAEMTKRAEDAERERDKLCAERTSSVGSAVVMSDERITTISEDHIGAYGIKPVEFARAI